MKRNRNEGFEFGLKCKRFCNKQLNNYVPKVEKAVIVVRIPYWFDYPIKRHLDSLLILRDNRTVLPVWQRKEEQSVL